MDSENADVDIDIDIDAAGPSTSLLRPQETAASKLDRPTNMTKLGLIRAYWLGTVVCIGGFLFGYDSGIIGGVLTLKSYRNDFRYGPNEATHVSSLGVGLQSLGAFVACFFVWPLTHKYGRRIAIGIAAFVFLIGAMIQTINTHSVTAFYFGRLIAGLGLGASSVVVPMYSSEMVPKEIRGQVGSFYQLMFTLGIFTSYWTDWGIARNFSSTDTKQWQIPIGMQMLFAGLLGLGMLTLKESTRWLTSKGRHEEAWESLRWIRADDGPDAQAEMEEIREGVLREAHAREGFHLKEMVNKSNLRRTLTGSAVFIAQQATGATAFAYFAPQYFQVIVGKSGNKDLLLTAIFGAVKFVACLAFVILVADNVPRRYILTAGALFMAACQIAAAAIVKTHPAPTTASKEAHTSPAGIATIAMIYLFVVAYNFSWGPLPWPYVAEIFPTRIREPGIAIGVSSQWLFNFVFSTATPYMIKNMGWGTFLLWGLFDFCIAFFSWFVLTETKGRSLEEIVVATSVGDHKDLVDKLEYGQSSGQDWKQPGVNERE